MIFNIRVLTLGPIIKAPEENLSLNTIRIWGRGKKISNYECYLICGVKHSLLNNYIEYKTLHVSNITDYTGMIEFDNLDPDNEYEYQMGYFHKKSHDNDYELNWSDFDWGKFRTAKELLPIESTRLPNLLRMIDSTWSFIFGSCRRYVKCGPFSLFGTGKAADKIYGSIGTHDIDFFMSIGDQVYFDPLGNLNRDKTLKQMRNTYKKVRSFKQIKNLMANTSIYEICDDHDIHRNDTNYRRKIEEPDVWENGYRAYMEYQHLKGVTDNHLWYTFERNNATFFVFDTRTERDERTIDDNGKIKERKIIGDYQLKSFQNWITDPSNSYKIKFVVSSVPIISQNTEDSFYGFPEQQKKIIDLMIGKDMDGFDINNVIILTGDAHCARTGIYYIYDQNDIYTGNKLTEILSSGLAAINHDKGKKLIHTLDNLSEDDIKNYDDDNNFPYKIDNIEKGGLKFVTSYSSNCYPIQKSKSIRNKIQNIFTQIVDNVYTNLTINKDRLIVEVYNQDGELLNSEVIQLVSD